jgi:hypothetical protein
MSLDGNWADSVRVQALEAVTKGEYKEATFLYLQIHHGAQAQATATLHLAKVMEETNELTNSHRWHS